MQTENWLKELFYSHYQDLCRIAYRYLRNADASEDVVQDCFIKLWEKHQSIEPQKYLSYLSVSVKNSCISLLRKQDNTVSLDSKEALQQTCEFNTSLTSLTAQQTIDKAISQLPQRCRLIFTMSRFQKKKYQEIADELGLSIKTVENQMGKAIKIMREYARKSGNLIILLWLL